MASVPRFAFFVPLVLVVVLSGCETKPAATAETKTSAKLIGSWQPVIEDKDREALEKSLLAMADAQGLGQEARQKLVEEARATMARKASAVFTFGADTITLAGGEANGSMPYKVLSEAGEKVTIEVNLEGKTTAWEMTLQGDTLTSVAGGKTRVMRRKP